jgi:hypothetical protein
MIINKLFENDKGLLIGTAIDTAIDDDGDEALGSPESMSVSESSLKFLYASMLRVAFVVWVEEEVGDRAGSSSEFKMRNLRKRQERKRSWCREG